MNANVEVEIPVPSFDMETAMGASWAEYEPSVVEQYANMWVVAINQEIITAGTDPKKVREDAAKKLPHKDARTIVVGAVAALDERTPDA